MDRSNGSQERIYTLLRFLSNIFADLILYSYSDHPSEPWTEAARRSFAASFPAIQLILEPQGKLRRLTKLKNAALKIAPSSAARILKWRSANATPIYNKLRAQASASTPWLINYADGLTQLNGLPDGRILVDTHDLKFLSHCKSKGESPTSISAVFRMRGEIAALNCTAGLVAISPAETAFFQLLCKPPVFYVPVYAMENPPTKCTDRSAFRYDLLLVASQNELNIRGFLAFLQRSYPWIKSYRIALAGRICEDQRIQEISQDGSIALLGFLPDLAPVYAASKACLSPTDGTGVKIKAIEALRHGRPVFGSEHTIHGLPPGSEKCVFPLKRASIERLLADPVALNAAAEEAKNYISNLTTAFDLQKFAESLLWI